MRVKGLPHCGLQVPSLEIGHDFYRGFGLHVAERGDAFAIRCDGRETEQALLTEDSRKQLQFVGFAVDGGLHQPGRAAGVTVFPRRYRWSSDRGACDA
ncbi:hypothetical protein ACQP1G_10780 [Nocardia sp. CA-107356]|uniref:hypothetical protein n=1 Tax=Nocardia sp. CA-107356 TaxID=3239972 RepID=UPI003D89D323